MKTDSKNPFYGRIAMSALILISCAACSRTHVVTIDVADKTLRHTLESWKQGKSPESMKQAKPPVVVQDMDWSAGATLVSFEVLDGGKPVDANLYAKVKLTLRAADGSESEKNVTYCVGTSPTLTVFRDMFH